MNHEIPTPKKINCPLQELATNNIRLSRSDLREQRTQELLEKCQQEILQQIIGPFGLTPAMFEDKIGGNVTTQHNANQGIFSKEIEEFDREKDYSYKKAKDEIMLDAISKGTLNSQSFKDSYTGEETNTKRVRKDGKLVMNAELDHTIPLKKSHVEGGWMLDKKRRNELASEKDNLNYTSFKINRSKSAKDAEIFLSEENGFDPNIIKPIIERAEEGIEKHMPSTKERVTYHGKELATNGGKEAIKQGLRQAMGVLLHEFANHSFIEVKRLIRTPVNQENFLDELVESLQKVAERVIAKLRNALEALISGGVQGFISNLLTFLINNFVTTAAKVVTMIREGMNSLWNVIKLLLNPPEQMSSADIARQATKIIVSSLTVALGLVMEESVKTFILTIPFLIPIAEVLATGLTAILTGLLTALMVYGIDRLFDAMQSKGTELLEAMEANADAQANMVLGLADLLEKQVTTAKLYETSITNYKLMHGSMTITTNKFLGAAKSSELTSGHRASTIQTIQDQTAAEKLLQSELDALLTRLEQRK